MVKMKNKKSLIIAGAAVAIIGIGVTVAFNSDRIIFSNQFQAADQTIEYTDSFSSPDSWKPCDTTPKTVSATNKSSANVTVRIKLDDYWKDKNDNDLADLVSGNTKLTSINFHNGWENNWEKRGDWYYYKTELAPNATTEPLIDSVSLSCEANLAGEANYSSDGLIAQTGENPYAGAKFHVVATIQAMQTDAIAGLGTLYKEIVEQANPFSYEIDFTRKATISNDVSIANGNGVNKYKENGADIYYFRGNISNNHVIWSGFCWKIVRTTSTGGIKMIYNGVPSNGQCNATGVAAGINNRTYQYNSTWNSPADIGYKHGAIINLVQTTPGSRSYVFANDVSRSGNTYTLSSDSISGTWSEKRSESGTRYHYFCTTGESSCNNTQIGYIVNYGYPNTIYYLPINGYDDVEAAKTAMYANTTDSTAKSVIESWFESNHLDDNALEDAVFCNDRTITVGVFRSKDSPNTSTENGAYSFYGAYARNVFKNAANNVAPSLDCTNPRDAFQVSNNNAKLKHKIGLPTSDEVTLAGIPWFDRGNDTQNYLYTGQYSWLGSPSYVGEEYTDELRWGSDLHTYYTGDTETLRPMVSLKAGTIFASGTGLKTDPYIAE